MRVGPVEVKDLKSCPFCAAPAVAENFVLEAAVSCKGCRARIIRVHKAREDTGIEEAIAAWNRRSP